LDVLVDDESPPNRPPASSSEGGGVELAPRVRVPASALRVQFARGSGPGGQNVNKLNTKAELWVRLDDLRSAGVSSRALQRLEALAGRRITAEGEIHLASDVFRSQERNRQEAFDRLREMLIRALVEPKARRKTRPSRAARERRLTEKKHRGKIKAERKRKDEG